MKLLFVMLGGAIGASLRYLSTVGATRMLGKDFPYGTLLVNVSGSLLMGLLSGLFISKVSMSEEWRLLLLTGVLGAFTTFSAFSIETITLFDQGAIARGVLNILLNVFLCLAAVWIGLILARQF